VSLPAFREDWDIHEDQIAHLAIAWHGCSHFPGIGGSDTGGCKHHLGERRVPRALGQLGKHEVTRQIRRDGFTRGASFRTIDPGRNELLDIGNMSEPQLPDQAHARDVSKLIELATIILSQFFGKLAGRAAHAPLNFPMGFRGGNSVQRHQ
jgi:hypothetical protein